MVRFLGVQTPISVVHCGPSPHLASNEASPAGPLDPRLGLEAERYLLVPGRTDFEGKGLDVLLAAHDGLGEAWPAGVQVVFVGPPGTGHKAFLEQLQKSDAGRGRLIYLGRVEDDLLHELYAHGLATVIPSRSEGFGFPVLEAMAHGVPVICSNAGSLPEVAGEAALLFASGDSKELAVKIQQMAVDPALRKQLIERGKAQWQKFSWETCAREMKVVFERAATRQPERRP